MQLTGYLRPCIISVISLSLSTGNTGLWKIVLSFLGLWDFSHSA